MYRLVIKTVSYGVIEAICLASQEVRHTDTDRQTDINIKRQTEQGRLTYRYIDK